MSNNERLRSLEQEQKFKNEKEEAFKNYQSFQSEEKSKREQKRSTMQSYA
jgi:hypothetical protein